MYRRVMHYLFYGVRISLYTIFFVNISFVMDAAMGMTSALAAAGTGRREGGGGDGDGFCTGGGRTRPKEEGSASRSCGGGGDGGAGRVDKEASCPRTEVRDGLSACIEGP